MSALRNTENFVDCGGTFAPRALSSHMIEGRNGVEFNVNPFDRALAVGYVAVDPGRGNALVLGATATNAHLTTTDFASGSSSFTLSKGGAATGITGSFFESGSTLSSVGETPLFDVSNAWQLGALVAGRGGEILPFPVIIGTASEGASIAGSSGGLAAAPKGAPKDDDHIGQLLDKYALLEDDWLDDRSKAPGKAAVDRARSLYLSSREALYPPKRCYVSSDGEVGLVWEKGKGYGNVGFWVDGSVVYYVRSVDGSKEVRNDLFFQEGENLPAELIKALRAFHA